MVYFIQNVVNKKIKIGFSSDPTKRIKSLQTASSDKLKMIGKLDGDRKFETELHNQFSHLRCGGEWFTNGEDLITFIKHSKEHKKKLNPDIEDLGYLNSKDTMVCWDAGGGIELFGWPDKYRLSRKYRYSDLACYSHVQNIETSIKMQNYISDMALVIVIHYKVSPKNIHKELCKLIGYNGCYASTILCGS
ncbi:MAG: GIY-YIG nuclease family protein [Candidatus Zapsychrus exili]|nr:GIY-YIG nuclease family protein [Candidatus Zapsychrus exili]